MSQDQNKFQIEQLRQTSLTQSVQAIMMMVGALFITILLPSLLMRYVYGETALYTQPKTLEYIPVGSFLVGAFYLVKTFIGNMRRGAQIKKLMMEMTIMDGGEDFDDEEWEKELAELEAMLKEDDKKPAKKKATKKSSKKTTSKAAKKTTKKSTAKKTAKKTSKKK
jgi:hypothetical protein